MVLISLLPVAGWSTPSTLVWIPSTDIQPKGVWHLGIDDSLGVGSEFSLPTDIGMTYGLAGWEAGVDVLGGTHDPVFLNAKVALPVPGRMQAAVGLYNASTRSTKNTALAYAVVSHPLGRLRATLGYYAGRREALAGEHSGILAGLDTTLPNGWWMGADYQGGSNVVGAFSVGASHALADKVSLLLGWQHWRLDQDSVTTQIDVDF